MALVDCAHDGELASELLSYLIKSGHQATLDVDIITINEKNAKNILVSFLKDTKKQDYFILESDTNIFVVAKLASLDQIGFVKCEFCGKAFSNEEKLDSHKIVHGQGMPPVN